MLKEKDYCDYDTCVALREVGCRIQTEWYIHQPSYERGSCCLCFGIPRETSVLDECDYIPRLSLYEAQKWLREEKNTIVEANFNLMHEGQPRFSWRVLYNLTQHKGAYYTFDSVKSKEDCDSFEEAFSEGILTAVEILKENETIHE